MGSGCKSVTLSRIREVAQLGSAPALGAGGRRFKSFLPDVNKKRICGLFPTGPLSFVCLAPSNSIKLISEERDAKDGQKNDSAETLRS